MAEAVAAEPGAGLEPEPERREVGVIDIGSNSVRLVQFRLEDRALWPVFNEKTMAGLGRGMGETGRLNPDGVDAAMRTLRRFAALLDARDVSDRRAVATAAVRAAADGPDFIARVRDEIGLEIEVIDGAEEGRLSALGVLAGVGDAHGLAGDLGGSSLELTPLTERRTGDAISLPLGPLAVFNAPPYEIADAKRAVDAALERAGDMLEAAGPTFYAVGGAWRAFARLSMAQDGHPLGVLHQYAMTRAEVMDIADFASKVTEASISDTPGVPSKRAATLPYAAYLLRRLLKRGRFERVVFSAYGLREGVAFSREPRLIADGDPLVAGAEALARAASPEPGFGAALARWIEPVFEDEAPIFSKTVDARLRAAACRLADLGARMHPDHRADLAATQVLYAPFAGAEHAERAFLALSLHHRYAGKKPRDELCPSRRLLDEPGEDAAMRLGLALRLGAALSGRSEALLDAFRLERTGRELVLRVDPGREDLVVERALSRLETLAAAFGLSATVI